jgi:hypothetical protein
MAVWRSGLVLVCASVAVPAACSLSGTDDLATANQNDSGSTDASNASDASQDVAVAPDVSPTPNDAGQDAANPPNVDSGAPNILTNGDFELGCAGWSVSFGFLSESSTAYEGSKSCKFCMDTNWEAFLQREQNGLAVKAGEEYVGDIWFRPVSTPEQLADAGYVSSSLWISAGGGDGKATPGPPPTSGWSRASTLFTIPADTDTAYLTFHLQQQGNPAAVGNVICVYVDSASLRRIK